MLPPASNISLGWAKHATVTSPRASALTPYQDLWESLEEGAEHTGEIREQAQQITRFFIRAREYMSTISCLPQSLRLPKQLGPTSTSVFPISSPTQAIKGKLLKQSPRRKRVWHAQEHLKCTRDIQAEWSASFTAPPQKDIETAHYKSFLTLSL